MLQRDTINPLSLARAYAMDDMPCTEIATADRTAAVFIAVLRFQVQNTGVCDGRINVP
ncbi:MAG: hypothetical protein OXE42_01860 [Gammaproteobacteria bacterium]|nr:hypothetical protein [Gammaproteobacteria bacterium]